MKRTVPDDTPVGPRRLDTEEMRQRNGGWPWVVRTARHMVEATVRPFAALAIPRDVGERIAAALKRQLDETFPTGAPWHASWHQGQLEVAWGMFSELAQGLRRDLAPPEEPVPTQAKPVELLGDEEIAL